MNRMKLLHNAPPGHWHLRAFGLLLAANGLILAGSGCESKPVVPCGPLYGPFTPTCWHCWGGGPLAYRECDGPVVVPQPESMPPGVPPRESLPDNAPPEPLPPAPTEPKTLPSEKPAASNGQAGHYANFVDDDAAMQAAVEMARTTVGDFIAALKSPRPGQYEFQVCKAIHDGPKTEYVWLTDVYCDGKNFSGLIGVQPREVKNVRFGQRETVETADITDWMYVEKQNLVGGFTVRALRRTLSPTERVALDKSVPFIIDASTAVVARSDALLPAPKAW